MLLYRYTHEAKRITSEAGITTSEFKLPPRGAALCVLVCLAALMLRFDVAEVGEGTLRVDLMTGEVVGIDALAAPCWTSRYIFEREKKVKIRNLCSCSLEGKNSLRWVGGARTSRGLDTDRMRRQNLVPSRGIDSHLQQLDRMGHGHAAYILRASTDEVGETAETGEPPEGNEEAVAVSIFAFATCIVRFVS